MDFGQNPAQSQYNQYLNSLTPEQVLQEAERRFGPIEPPQTQEEMGDVVASAKGWLAESQHGIGAGLHALGFEDTAKGWMDVAQAHREEVQQRHKPDIQELSDIASLSGIKELAAMSAPHMAAAGAGAAAGAALGSVVPVIGTAIGAAAGGTLAMLPYFFGENVKRQQDTGVELDDVGYTKALGAGILQAGINAFAVGKLARLPRAARETVMKNKAVQMALRGENTKGFWRGAAQGIIKGGALEGLTEAAQDGLGVLQADPDKIVSMHPEVVDELIMSFVGGAVLGGALGGVGGAAEVSSARKRMRLRRPRLKPGKKKPQD
jgi:hypothetical protein